MQGGRNLEDYLRLIVKVSKPQIQDQYRFYLNAKNRLINGESIDDVLSSAEFAFAKGEAPRRQFWRVLVNTSHDLGPGNGSRVITHVLEHIQDYSLIEIEKIGIGLRDNFSYYLIKLLDTVGWSDGNARSRNNTPENIAEIAEWIFGERRHADRGVLNLLADVNRGPTGLFDLMVFRLYCCVDRGGSAFNLQRALSLHSDPGAPTAGQTNLIVIPEMRELSQRVFKIFKMQYIVPQKNIFTEIDKLDLRELAGKYFDFVLGKIASSEVAQEVVDLSLATTRSRMKMFITYQLSNKLVSSGVGCGYYDEEGTEDQNNISSKMNDYLFQQCFSPSGGRRNFECFLDYLLLNFASNLFADDDKRYTPTEEEFTKILNRTRLADYWLENRETIRSLNFDREDKKVINGNYSASYSVDLVAVYEVLDSLAGAHEIQRSGLLEAE